MSPTRRRAAALATVLTAALAGLAATTATPSQAASPPERSAAAHHRPARATPVTLRLGRRGPAFTSFGFDVKGAGVAGRLYDHRTLAPTPFARTVFGAGRIALIRIPVFAGASAFSGGQPTYAGYAHYVDAVRAAQRVDPDVKVFASLVTVCPGDTTRCLELDRSLKVADAGPVDPAAYGRFLAGYLAFLDGSGVHVDYLGMDNEGNGGTAKTWVGTNNEGQISGARFAATIDAVDAGYDGVMPTSVFNDSTVPDLPTLSTLTAGQWARVGVVAHHYSANRRTREGGPAGDRHLIPFYLAELDQLARVKHAKPVWNTEFHFTYGGGKRNDDDYGHSVVSMKALFDQLDDHGTGITWWGYLDPALSGVVRSLETQVTASLRAPGGPGAAGGRPVPTTDDDGTDAGQGLTRFTTRGIVLGHDVLVWAVNATGRDRTRLPVVLRKGTSATSAAIRVPDRRSVTAVQWRRAGSGLRSAKASTDVVHHTARVTFPAHSITLVRIAGVA